MRRLVFLALALTAALGPAPAAWGAPWELEARSLAVPLVIDGAVEAEAWGATSTLRFLSDLHRPMPARARTRVWIGHNDEGLALAWINDELGLESESLAAPADGPSVLDDSHVEVLLRVGGESGTTERTYRFAVNPANARHATKSGDPQWSGEWTSATMSGPGVWSAEMKIPYAAIGLSGAKGKAAIALTRRVRGAAEETQGWPWEPVGAESRPMASLRFGGPEEEKPPTGESQAFWGGWATRLDELETSASALLALQDFGRIALARDLLLDELDRAAQVDPAWGPSAGAAEPGMRATLGALEERINAWLGDLRSGNPTPSLPDRMLQLRLPAPGGIGLASSSLLFCGVERASDEPRPLVINLHPEGVSAFRHAERFLRWRRPRGEPFLLLTPESGGPLSGHAYDGEEEIWQAVEAVSELYAVDKERLYVVGASTGGSAAIAMGARMPDRFAAVASIGGGAPASLLDNLQALPVYLCHTAGEDSIAARFNLAWEKKRREIKAPGGLIEAPPGEGDLLERAVDEDFWGKILSHQRSPQPSRVQFHASSLRHNRAYWVQVDRFLSYPPEAVIEFEAKPGNQIEGRAEGVAALSFELSPPTFAADEDTSVTINGRLYYLGPHRPTIQIEFAPRLQGEFLKTPALGGPLDDAFRGPALYVWGTAGGSEWSEALRSAAENAAARPGFHAKRMTIADTNLSPDQMASANLFLFGGPQQNHVVAQLKDDLPVAMDRRGIRVAGQTFSEDDTVAQFCWPNPRSPERYLVFHWANKPGAMRRADWFPTPFRFQLLPDGVVDRISDTPGPAGNRRRIADWWFAEDWRSPALRMVEKKP